MLDVYAIERHLKACLKTSKDSGKTIWFVLTEERLELPAGHTVYYSGGGDAKTLTAVIRNQELEKVAEVEVYAPQLFEESTGGN